MSTNICADGYARPSLAADIVLFTLIGGKLNILLIERGQEPYKGQLALPGGFVKEYEAIIDSAKRELKEETGFNAPLLEQFGIFDKKARDPRGWYISIAFFAVTADATAKITAGTDAAATQWFPIHQLPGKLAFDHSEIIQQALSELRQRAERFDITIMRPLFALLGETFTLSQLQEAFDAVGAQYLQDAHVSDKRNFRKRVLSANIIEEVSGEMLRGKHRPAQLYRAIKRKE